MTYGIIAALAIVGVAVTWCWSVRRNWRRLEALVSGGEGVAFSWDGPFPILSIDADKASSAEVTALLEQVRKCSPRLLEVWVNDANDAHSTGLGKLQTLEKLYLTGSAFTGLGLRQLSGLRRMEVLGFENCNLTDADLPNLLAMTELDQLSLEGTRVTVGGLAVLKPLPFLKAVTLDGLEHQISRSSRP